ncbi:TonB-dependent receptor plug domain-containing protein [Zavarzinia compransoris]|uniref:TonB-dependent receptor n=1 Tax=Zavarzinia compransoris TaxID=1264899 RepID=A0A317DZ55_9PROT|nr:TonB-dependent receptor [Zavarzinia compransoris]PWR20068.1 TonB-dependent receptor [Zavarzinia compransoris]TDP44810.1 iron complex outermembrane receptor protein [Zavarzinia compransoris]
MTLSLRRATSAVALMTAVAPALFAAPARADGAETLPTVVVEGTPDDGGAVLSGQPLASKAANTGDTAALLSGLPGVTLAAGGAFSSLPALNGFADDRVRLLVDGMTVTAACPNHMNPPLVYMAPGRVARIEAIAGITPVSLGGDSIGGTIVVEPEAPAFADPGGELVTGRVSTFYRSNGDALSVFGTATAAKDDLSLTYAGSWSRTGDYDGGGPGRTVRATEGEAYDHNLTLGIRRGGDRLTLRGGLRYSPYEAFPNQYMDLTDNQSQYLNGRYQGEFAWGRLDLRAYWQHVEHEMDMLADKGGAMPMNTRTTDLGYSVTAEVPLSDADTLRFGTELHSLAMDDWWPPVAGSMMMGPGTFENIDDGTRTRIGAFAEWEAQWNSRWSTLLGLRGDLVLMDTGDVRPYGSGMMQAADVAAANAFNALDRGRSDVNVDATALLRFEPSETAAYSFGYARKTRSPSLYERYSWGRGDMAMSMINWFGDGNGYVGNPDLEPEVAHTLGLSGDWHAADGAWRVKVTPYLSYVEDFIDADPAGSFAMASPFAKLRFANHDALLYGADVSVAAALVRGGAFGDLDLGLGAGFVKGENRDTGDDLYRLAPLHGRITLDHRLGEWSNALELIASARKSDVSGTRRELETPGYALVNLRTAYQWDGLRIDAGIDNLLDQRWYDPLGGVDLVEWGNNQNLKAVEGEGRSFNIGLTVAF